jgi:hypothetical protein
VKAGTFFTISCGFRTFVGRIHCASSCSRAGTATIQLEEATDMQSKSIAFFVAALAAGVAASPALAEEYRGTMEQQMACTPDVWRLCGDQIPDVNRIVACLRQNTPLLSEGCRAVFNTSNREGPLPHGRRPPPPAAPPVQPPPRGDDWFRQE